MLLASTPTYGGSEPGLRDWASWVSSGGSDSKSRTSTICLKLTCRVCVPPPFSLSASPLEDLFNKDLNVDSVKDRARWTGRICGEDAGCVVMCRRLPPKAGAWYWRVVDAHTPGDCVTISAASSAAAVLLCRRSVWRRLEESSEVFRCALMYLCVLAS